MMLNGIRREDLLEISIAEDINAMATAVSTLNLELKSGSLKQPLDTKSGIVRNSFLNRHLYINLSAL